MSGAFGPLEFGAPEYLWLLGAPATLLVLWAWQFAVRLGDRRRLARRRTVPAVERFPRVGELGFWLCLVCATALVAVALARPRAVVSVTPTAGVDLVVLLDGSASMRVADVPGNRWRRSMRFTRALAETLHWSGDRIALATFARIATPQVRLTRDPNAVFFFLDHLDGQSPFRLEDDTTWDTNIESGIRWGVKLLEKDEQLHGPSQNAKAFVLLSDGQAWSGEVERALQLATRRGIPVFVVGVGTASGGPIPEPAQPAGTPSPPAAPLRASLDRPSLQAIALRGAGTYFELGRETDRAIADTIIVTTRRRAISREVDRRFEELYWRCLVAAAVCAGIGLLFVRGRAELWVTAVGAVVVSVVVNRLLG